MIRHLAILMAMAMVTPASALASAGNFTLVNKTGAAIGETSIRRSGTGSWKPLTVRSANGGRTPVSFNDPDCAFDLQVKLGNGEVVTYSGVNLCDVSTVTLNRSSDGTQWVDYD